MTTRMQRVVFGCLAFLTFSAEDCDSELPRDPFTDADLQIAQHLDLGRTYGEVTGKRVEYAIEAHRIFDMVVGSPYYCITVRKTNANGQYTDTERCGVRQVVYDAVDVGTQLPIERILSVYEIAQLNGRIVDRQAAPWKPAWYITIDHATEVRVYRVDPQSYYRHLEIGQQLPFTIPRGGAASTPSKSSSPNVTEEQAIP